MSEHVIIALALASGQVAKAKLPAYVRVYDPNAAGSSYIEFTEDLDKALTFPSMADAWECWRQVSRVRPTRADGKPNRPLTAFTVVVTPKEKAEQEKARLAWTSSTLTR